MGDIAGGTEFSQDVGIYRGRQTCHFPENMHRRKKSLGIIVRRTHAPITCSTADRPLLLRTTSPDKRAHGMEPVCLGATISHDNCASLR